ncbi:unnamed protein product [Cuscuta epithymum]|uniref:Beta-hexosaminidase n=2 Tax=Cuscuta epithymum TaxID=186058 RepID=A0AAV0CWM3_9ASTE|nr:unnamed protein product [Cuscuta epithymum]
MMAAMADLFIPRFFLIPTLLLLLSSAFTSEAGSEFPINVWPKPTIFDWPSPCAVPLSPDFTVHYPAHPYLTPAVSRYVNVFRTELHRPIVPPSLKFKPSPPLEYLNITVSDVSAPLTHGVNESYTLSVPDDGRGGALISSQTVWGAMRGLETFSQLVYDYPSRVAAGLYISDAPLFPHRGVLLDTSRNFYAVEDLLRLIMAISMNKMNVFHWHITDSQSFPLVLPSEPELAGRGSYGEEMKYSPEDVQKVVDFGMQYGVRVVPEIDMPGHTGSWAEAYPDIVTCPNMFWLSNGGNIPLAAEPGTGQLNPLNPKTYQVVKNVICDTIAMFPDTFYHAGADEINPNCWNIDPSIQKFVSDNGTLSQLLETFIKSTLPYIVSLNRTVVYWEDVLLSADIKVTPSSLPRENVILQTWNNGPNNTKRIVNAGYRVIVSSSDFFYLDCGHGGFLGNDNRYDQPPGTDQGNGGSWCSPFKTWQLIYNYDITYGLSDKEAKLVLGGEVALWSEQADATVLDSRVWPRASAMAESLWSGNTVEMGKTMKKRSGEVTNRLNEWRYRMVSRGIGAEPIQPLWCVKNPGMCDAVYPFSA